MAILKPVDECEPSKLKFNMVTTVIFFNLLISAFCLWLAWRIGRLRRRLARIADVLVMAEKRTDLVLFHAPNQIIRGQQGSRWVRQRYALVAQQWAQVEKLLAILSLVLGVWRRRSRHQR
ncbi:MAG: hypothetical protein J7540_01125 [Roseofilum sp. SID2]|uniref:hypothetical protein n=2 Tax=Roseofilum TaxID=1233426 RepID=UPI001B2084BB|nr:MULTISPECIES: hypothetical protein [unclassified Roseofilum]MBP0012383.1 hypothetical protein [Roseofilum sp. SID3]MBP0022592.1 hypothetical protein [Roseofilum sp. SID2]